MVPKKGEVIVEFYGIPRQRAGCAEIRVPAGTAAEVLATIQQRFPKLGGLLDEQGKLTGEFLLSINGIRFVADLQQRLEAGERLLLLSADAGG